MKRYALAVLATAAITFAATAWLFRADKPVPQVLEPLAAVPGWMTMSDCAPMTRDERAQEEQVVQVLRVFPEFNSATIGAARFLGRDRFRRTEKTSQRLCRPDDLNAAIAASASVQRSFTRPHLFADELRLAQRLGPGDPAIVAAVARTAFHASPISTEYPESKADIRSLARVALAEFGSAAAPWADQAFAAMHARDAMGTSAAQVAVAAGHRQALGQVSELLSEILTNQTKNPVKRAARDRFYELAYALALVRADAIPHSAPIIRIMSRTVESWAPPFGMVSLAPRRMCRVLEMIGGADAGRLLASEICNPTIDVYEQ